MSADNTGRASVEHYGPCSELCPPLAGWPGREGSWKDCFLEGDMGLSLERGWLTRTPIVLCKAPAFPVLSVAWMHISKYTYHWQRAQRDRDCFGQRQNEGSGRYSQRAGEMAQWVRVLATCDWIPSAHIQAGSSCIYF